MDGLKISSPVDVSVSAKFMMGSEGCGGSGGGGGGVRVSSSNNKADNNNCDKIKTVRVNSSIDRCSVSISKKGAGSSSGASDSSLWRKLMHSHDFVHDRLTKLRVENPSETQNGYHLPIGSPESADSSRKRGKLSRCSSSSNGSGSGSSKRTKLFLLDDTVNTTLRENETKEICGGQGSTLSDKPLVVKQRHSCNGKRSEKRNPKVPTRTFSTINSTTGENAFFGAYGLKPAVNDVTKLIEDLSLNKLLEGSYECSPSLSKKDKMMKKSENSNDPLLSVVRNVWSILPTRKPLVHQSQTSAELDACINRTIGSPISATLNGENSVLDGDISSSSSKDHCEIPSNPLNFPLCEATDVLKKLGLPPSKDLDSLLQDASKLSSQNSKNKNSDQQQQPPRVGLPYFPWSQAFSGSSRTNSEATKLLTGKTLCQGRWLRIANNTTLSSSESIIDNLDSLTFNRSLVPPLHKQTVSGTETSAKTTPCQCTEASVSTVHKASFVPTEPEASQDVKDDVAALSCPQLIEAAQTLCDIAIHKPANREDNNNNNNPNGILRWPKKLSQKSMQARKSKLIEKPPHERHHHVTTTTVVSSSDLNPSNNTNHVRKDSAVAAERNHHHHHHHHNHQQQQHQHHHFPKPSKRLKLSSMVDNKKGLSSSFPSSSSVSAVESDRKHSSSSSSSKFKNHSRLMPPPPPPSRTLQKSSTYPQKSRKFPGNGLI